MTGRWTPTDRDVAWAAGGVVGGLLLGLAVKFGWLDWLVA